MIHNTVRAWYATCKMQHATKPSSTFFEIAVFKQEALVEVRVVITIQTGYIKAWIKCVTQTASDLVSRLLGQS